MERMLELQVPSWRIGEERHSPLVIHDFNVLGHRVVKFLEENWHEEKEGGRYESYIKALWVMVINRGPDCIPLMNARHVIVRDIKDDLGMYWRGVEGSQDPRMADAWATYAETKKKDLSEIPIAYKGNRGDKSDTFALVDRIGREYVTKYFPVFGAPGYEADDWAGAVYRICTTAGTVAGSRYKFLHTIDRDWTQLVDEKYRLYWANTRYNLPREKIQGRLVGNQEVLEHTEYKARHKITHPRELLGIKIQVGDMGDNLPVGTPAEYYDLMTAHLHFNVDNLDGYPRLVIECNNPLANTRVDHLFTCVEQFAGMKLPFLTALNGNLS